MPNKPWVAFWKQDLLSSLNYQSLSVFGKGIYGVLFTLCRDDEYCGQFCYPNGMPLTIDEIIDAMGIKQGDRRDRIKENIEDQIKRGLLFWNVDKRLEMRKYADKTTHITEKSAGSRQEVGRKLSNELPRTANELPRTANELPRTAGSSPNLSTAEGTQHTTTHNTAHVHNNVVTGGTGDSFTSLLKSLLSVPFTIMDARDIIAKYPASRIEKALETAKKQKPKNPAGLIVKYLREEWN